MQREKGWCIWVTGLPGSGKSTVADLLLKELSARNIHAQLVSIDMLRRAVTPKPTYSEEERDIVYAALVFSAKLLTDNGVNVIIDATGNRQRYRNQARKQIERFIEVYLRCPLEVCMERESKRKNTHLAPEQIYRKGLTGKSQTVPGINVPYEEPTSPEIIIDTDKSSPEESIQKILDRILKGKKPLDTA
ncbi:MAG: adenylyl-sulfate kinase [Candidatus Bathyarchaeia archaeon]|jgi:adenylylsulfate kinase|nr:adenylyl-sulfate kinase [Candidatus Bathyarchaeota archaeon A05DMB-4]MDH7595412.1 adenylyl-sulfate kinase [Candidatus Bathyarchaeota archaeon]